MGRTKTTAEYKEDVFKLVGDEYTILGEYKDSKTKIRVRHNCEKCNNYEYDILSNYFARGRRCPKCSTKNFKKTTDMFKEEVFKLVGDEYTVLGEYKNNQTKIRVRHNCEKCNNYEWSPSPTWFLRGTRCPRCNGGQYEKTHEEFLKDVFNQVGDDYTILGNYVDSRTKLKVRHNCEKCNNHEYEVSPSNFLQGYRCPKCSQNTVSNVEKSLVEFVKQLDDSILENDRVILNGKELDIYVPNSKIAIEFDGLYWHSEQMGKTRNYHLEKTIECANSNIRLIHIFEDEWVNKEAIVKAKLTHIFNKNTNPKIFARKCYIDEIDTVMKNEFLNNNHIQGEDKSTIKLGLWCDIDGIKTLVSVMTFCKPRTSLGQKDSNVIQYDYELSRFASNINYNVIGGFSKLLSYFIKNYNWDRILTYADKRWSEGNVYIKNGWSHIHDSKPNYWYCTSNDIRLHRYNFRKNLLKTKFPDKYSDELTEFQIMNKTKYRRIWDCGNMVFEYINDKGDN